MKTKILICVAALLGVAAVVNRVELPLAKVTVRVLNEEKRPAPGATVRFGFRDRFTGKDVFVTGVTDAEGLFTGEGGCDPSGIGGEITKEGFYPSGAPIEKFPKSDPVTNHWLPWNETYTTVLRPVTKPVPLCAKWLRKLELPVLDQPCGYDLEKGDWVAPYGLGAKADFVFKGHREYYRDWFDFSVEAELSFSQPLDGLTRMSWADVGRYSVFKWEREAPASGYAAPHRIRMINRDPRGNERPEVSFDSRSKDKGYFFRVRTVEQNGRIISANYGKITSDIGIDARDTKTCYVYFTYYFNPTPLDRNLEWDTKRNLLSGLSFEQTPRDP